MKLFQPHITRVRIAATLVSPVIALSSAFAFAQSASGPRPDALLSIDLNRTAIVERIAEQWKGELGGMGVAAFKEKLMGLRADQLMAANLSGNFDTVLESLASNEAAQRVLSGMSTESVDAERALSATRLNAQKAIGELDKDLVYTPIAPCRIFDTRVSQGGSGPLTTLTPTKVFDTSRPSSNFATQGGNVSSDCGIPSGVQGVVINLSTLSQTTASFVTLFANNGTDPYPYGVAQWYQQNVINTTTNITQVEATGNHKVKVRVGAGSAEVVGDAVGYFMPPSRNGDGLRIIRQSTSIPSNVSVVNGAASNSISGDIRSATIAGGGLDSFFCRDEVTYSLGLDCRNEISSTYSTIGGGLANRIEGVQGTIAGGLSNKIGPASATTSVIGGGYRNLVTGQFASILGGYNNHATGDYSSIPGGFHGKTTLHGQMSHAAGSFSSNQGLLQISGAGEAQATQYILRNVTTTATPTALFLDGASARLLFANNTAAVTDIQIIGVDTATGATHSQAFRCRYKVASSVGTSSCNAGTPLETIPSTSAVSITAAPATNDLEIMVTGVAGKTIRWVATVRATEVKW